MILLQFIPHKCLPLYGTGAITVTWNPDCIILSSRYCNPVIAISASCNDNSVNLEDSGKNRLLCSPTGIPRKSRGRHGHYVFQGRNSQNSNFSYAKIKPNFESRKDPPKGGKTAANGR